MNTQERHKWVISAPYTVQDMQGAPQDWRKNKFLELQVSRGYYEGLK